MGSLEISPEAQQEISPEGHKFRSLKSVKFHVEPPAGGYATRGGRGGGRGGGGGRGKGAGGFQPRGRQAAPLISGMSDMLGIFSSTNT